MLSLICCTARSNPGYKNMVESIVNAMQRANVPIEFVAIDERMWVDDSARLELESLIAGRFPFQIFPPKPTPWRGKYRLTSRNYWAKNNAINTAICVARYNYLLFFDDCTMLNEDFISSHLPIVTRNVAVAGGYRYYHQGATVENGVIVSGKPHEPGDYRLTKYDGILPCNGTELFGGNVAYPLEALLKVNGASEAMDGAQGIEDQILGLCVERAGYKTMFNPYAVALQLTDTHAIIDGCSQGHPAAEIRGEPHVEQEPQKTKLFPYLDHNGVVHQYTYNHLIGWQLNAHKRVLCPDGVNYRAEYDPALNDERKRFKAFGNMYDLRALRKYVMGGRQFPKYIDQEMIDWRDNMRLVDM